MINPQTPMKWPLRDLNNVVITAKPSPQMRTLFGTVEQTVATGRQSWGGRFLKSQLQAKNVLAQLNQQQQLSRLNK
jgi:hypothetical protein